MSLFQRTLTIMTMLLMSWMFVISSATVDSSTAFVNGSAAQKEMVHDISVCGDGACAMNSGQGMNCQQHCDHVSWLMPEVLPISNISNNAFDLAEQRQYAPNPVLLLEPKPPQILYL